MPSNKRQLSGQTKVNIPTVWLILLVIIVAVGALFLYMSLNSGGPHQDRQTTQVTDQQVKELQNLSTSDDLQTIEKDLSTTNVEKLDEGQDEAVLGVQY